jgi:phosphoacetylglucosamine mutase
LDETLEQSWEDYVTDLANIQDDQAVFDKVSELVQKLSIDLSAPSKVVFGRDTHPSGVNLTKSLKDGLTAINTEYHDYEVLTGSQLHYIVRCLNTADTAEPYGEPTEEGYFSMLATSYKALVQGRAVLPTLTVDCANGVGAPKLAELAKHIGGDFLSVKIINDNVDNIERLNFKSGADFVKTTHEYPEGLSSNTQARFASLDGNADRLVYYYSDSETKALKLIDGDKISSLAAMFIKNLIQKANLGHLKIGVVQSPYANGNSTRYLTEVLELPLTISKACARNFHYDFETYDIGIYFEAKGHGDILFSPSTLKSIEDANPQSPDQEQALSTIKAFADLVNHTSGDALSNMLMVEAILTHKQWSLATWDKLYADLPSKLTKISVEDRSLFTTINSGTQLSKPEGLQLIIDDIVSQFFKGRAFVLPSESEDLVTIYSEAATESDCENLSNQIAALIYNQAGGKGAVPNQDSKSVSMHYSTPTSNNFQLMVYNFIFRS